MSSGDELRYKIRVAFKRFFVLEWSVVQHMKNQFPEAKRPPFGGLHFEALKLRQARTPAATLISRNRLGFFFLHCRFRSRSDAAIRV